MSKNGGKPKARNNRGRQDDKSRQAGYAGFVLHRPALSGARRSKEGPRPPRIAGIPPQNQSGQLFARIFISGEISGRENFGLGRVVPENPHSPISVDFLPPTQISGNTTQFRNIGLAMRGRESASRTWQAMNSGACQTSEVSETSEVKVSCQSGVKQKAKSGVARWRKNILTK